MPKSGQGAALCPERPCIADQLERSPRRDSHVRFALSQSAWGA